MADIFNKINFNPASGQTLREAFDTIDENFSRIGGTSLLRGEDGTDWDAEVVDWDANRDMPEWAGFADAVLGAVYGSNVPVGANGDAARKGIPREVTIMRSEWEILLTPTCVADYKYAVAEGTNAAWSGEDDKSCVVSGLYDIKNGSWRIVTGESIMPRIYCDPEGDAYWMFGQYKTSIRANGVPGPAGEGDRILVARGELSVIDGVRGVVVRKIWDASAGDNRFVDISESNSEIVPRVGTWAYAFAIDEAATPESAVTDVFMGPIDTKEVNPGEVVYFVGYDAAQSIGTLVGQFSLKRALMETGRADEAGGADALPFLFLNCGTPDKNGAWRGTGSWRFIPTHDKAAGRDILTVEHSGAPVTNDSYTEEDAEYKAAGADMRINGVDGIYKECKPDADVSLIEWGEGESAKDVVTQPLNSFGKIPATLQAKIPEILGLLRNVVEMNAPKTSEDNTPVFNSEYDIKDIPGGKEFCKALNAFFFKGRNSDMYKSLLKPAVSNQELCDILTYLLLMQGGSNLAVDNRINAAGGPAQKEYNQLKPVPLYNQLIINAVISHIYDLIGEEKESNNLTDFDNLPVNGYDANQRLQAGGREFSMDWGASNGEMLYKALTDFHEKGYGLASKTDVRKVQNEIDAGWNIPVGATIMFPRNRVRLWSDDEEKNPDIPTLHKYDEAYWNGMADAKMGLFSVYKKDADGGGTVTKQVFSMPSESGIIAWKKHAVPFQVVGSDEKPSNYNQTKFYVYETNGKAFTIIETGSFDDRNDHPDYGSWYKYTVPFFVSPHHEWNGKNGWLGNMYELATGIIPGVWDKSGNETLPKRPGLLNMEHGFTGVDGSMYQDSIQGMAFVVVQRIL